eukprot:236835_1
MAHKSILYLIGYIIFLSALWKMCTDFFYTSHVYINNLLGHSNIIIPTQRNSTCTLAVDLCERIKFDIEYYRNNTFDNISLNDLQICSQSKKSSILLVYIINGTVYYPKWQQYEWSRYNSEKAKMLIPLLKSVIMMYPNIPNTAFILDKCSTGHGCVLPHKNVSVPTFCIARSDSDNLWIENEYQTNKHCILFPNPYFESLFSWKNMSETILYQSKQIRNKTKKLFWFGGIYGKWGYGRLEFLLLANQTNFIDVYYKDWHNCKPCDYWRNHSDIFSNATDDDINKTMMSLRKKKKVSGRKFIELFGKYLANIALPGTTRGSYSRHLQFMLALDSVPFLWDNIWYEWYYNGLINNQNIIKVNKTNLYDETLRVLSMTDEQIDTIKQNKEMFFETHLSANVVAAYIYNLLVEYQSIQPKINWSEIKNSEIIAQ